jgi:hypothetical protein
MSNNWISNSTENVEKKWCNIRANSLSIGTPPCTLNTKTYTPSITSTASCNVGTIYLAHYYSNGNSLFITGVVDVTSTPTPANQLDIFVSLPTELISLFGIGGTALFAMGTLTEQDNNTLTNQGLISSSDFVGGLVDLEIMYAKSNTTTTPYRVRYQIQIHR